MSGILWGLCGALLIGASDCIARVTSRRVSVSILFLAIMGLSFTALTVYLTISADWPAWDARAWSASALSGFLNLLALFCLYRALAKGPVSVASPAASTFTVLLVAMNIIAGEIWSWMQVIALIVVFFGVAMLAQPATTDRHVEHYDKKWLRTTTLLGLAAAAAIALRMFLAQEASTTLGPLHGLYLNRVFALIGAILLVIYCIYKLPKLDLPTGKMRSLVFLQAVLETAALAAFLIGSRGDGRVGASIGFAGFAAASALFAWWWLGEAVGWQRSLWIMVVGVGVSLAILGAPSA